MRSFPLAVDGVQNEHKTEAGRSRWVFQHLTQLDVELGDGLAARGGVRPVQSCGDFGDDCLIQVASSDAFGRADNGIEKTRAVMVIDMVLGKPG